MGFNLFSFWFLSLCSTLIDHSHIEMSMNLCWLWLFECQSHLLCKLCKALIFKKPLIQNTSIFSKVYTQYRYSTFLLTICTDKMQLMLFYFFVFWFVHFEMAIRDKLPQSLLHEDGEFG